VLATAFIRKLGVEPTFVALCALTLPAGALAGIALRQSPPAPPEAAYIAPVTLKPPPFEVFSLLPIQVAHGRPVGGVQHVDVFEGDSVTIGIEADAPATVNVEGYDVWTYLRADEQTVIDLTASEYGNFAVKLDGRLIGVVQVRPAWARPA
jgi:hypothetical protein